MKIPALIFSFLLLMLTSCEFIERYKYNTGTFPDQPVNFSSINSECDDYNSASPSVGYFFPLCFSSTRNSQGVNFDIVYKFLKVNLNRQNGDLYIGEDTDGEWGEFSGRYANINNAVLKINTPYNEFGPSIILDLKNGYRSDGNILFTFLYSNNASGNQDIRYVDNLDDYSVITEPRPITWLNSPKDDAYPALTPDSSAIYFCSDRDGNFDIFRASLDMNKSIRQNLKDSGSKPITKEIVLSSDANDKCPFIMDSLMVFSSDRAGGYGGFDLYYSKFRKGKWSVPVNFGEKINTPFDEYRPIVKFFWDFTNDFMIFSSNRPGGKGGFDLYYVGIDKMNEK